MKVVYVVSLPYSGSTFLELMLSRHPDAIGVGELGHTLEVLSRFDDYGDKTVDSLSPCTCDRRIHDCEFWGELVDPLRRLPPEEGFQRVLQAFGDRHPGKVLIDSTKDVKYLRRHYFTPAFADQHELEIVSLIRDFRGWAPSVQRYRRENPDMDEISYLGACFRWLRKNLKNRRILRRRDRSFHSILYDHLVFEPRKQITRLIDRLGMASDPTVLERPISSHSVFGNPMRKKQHKRNQLLYDPTWVTDWKPWVLMPLLIPMYFYNQTHHNDVSDPDYLNLDVPGTSGEDGGFPARPTGNAENAKKTLTNRTG